MPNFTYTNNIPAAPHNPSVDQPDMQINTNSTEDLIAVDHFSFNVNEGGYHKKVSLVNNVGPFTTPAGVGSVMYSAADNWVFSNSFLAGAGVQMTVGAKPPIALGNGSTFLPGGLLLQWGVGLTTIPTGFFTQSYTYPFSVIFGATATAASLGSTNSLVSVNALSLTDITVYTNTPNGQPNGSGVFWMAIGLA